MGAGLGPVLQGMAGGSGGPLVLLLMAKGALTVVEVQGFQTHMGPQAHNHGQGQSTEGAVTPQSCQAQGQGGEPQEGKMWACGEWLQVVPRRPVSRGASASCTPLWLNLGPPCVPLRVGSTDRGRGAALADGLAGFRGLGGR